MAANDKPIDAITHETARRANIPPAELEGVLPEEDKQPIKVAYKQRNPDLDPQLVWRGKDMEDWSDIVVDAPPIYLQEQVHPKAIIEDLRAGRERQGDRGPSLFDHFGVTDEDREAEVEFYRHSKRWSNRMILGDSLQVMASLAEREGLKGQVQAIYIDPPYGIKFNSNFQWSTTSRDVKDGKLEHLTREPEQVKAFRDTWRDGIHSYLTYLRDRLTVARELLTESGSCFVQISDENLHRVRALMDEVFGDKCFVVTIPMKKKGSQKSGLLDPVNDYLLWYSKSERDSGKVKFRALFSRREFDEETLRRFNRAAMPNGTECPLGEIPSPPNDDSFHNYRDVPERLATDWPEARLFYGGEQLTSGGTRPNQSDPVLWEGIEYRLKPNLCWKTTTRRPDGSTPGMQRLIWARRLVGGRSHLNYKRFLDDFGYTQMSNWWDGLGGVGDAVYVVQTNEEIIKRCILMASDPGDLVLDPTCGAGTTADVAEAWGRRWITIDTSRVAMALARARVMGAHYPYYLLADSPEGQNKEAQVSRIAPPSQATHRDIRHGFVYERAPHVVMSDIGNNAEIDVIWERMQPAVEETLETLNGSLFGLDMDFLVTAGGRKGDRITFNAVGNYTMPSGEVVPTNAFQEWEVPREAPSDWPASAVDALESFWQARIARQREIDASIAARAEFEYLYDKPYEDKKRVRVAGPFTVESLSPHKVAAVDEDGDLIDERDAASGQRERGAQEAENYVEAMLENLRKAGVHQQGKEDRIAFTSLKGWPGEWICAEGRYMEGEQERRAGIFIGPEYGTVQKADLVACAKEAADAGFDLVIACSFNFDAHAGEFRKLGRIPILQARMNPDLHMAGDLKAGGGNLFVVFGEPDIEVLTEGDKLRVKILGVDVFKPQTGEVISTEAGDIACWFIDTDYNEESFFVRHAYFPGAEVPYKALKTTLKAEIDEEAWESLKKTVSRPFARPASGRIAVKVINHLGDEVMKVIGV
ncbi:site-specific DNA-methyltransferase [Aliiruegeria lutimaris]|uniref:site-specific DNA-methyltransferase (adenine-specific) n=1 Tax=Aliiruegeria lutimaris TaxID=571298 RepID=A0A1G9KFJ6_9RHOB|nr:site-specific DNA-methyltransferase [Aliiruegeria lutimaris]SDL48133.1 adenine-specific DNA-methyltransferase [Aliiruegeria lutimaris]